MAADRSSQDPLHTAMGTGAEFDHIRALLNVWGPLAEGIGDDAAVLAPPPDQQLIISTDATVEGVHFRREWMSAFDTGSRGATAALSDLAAMGATARGVLVSLVVPETWRGAVPEFAAGIGAAARRAGARIVGGNLSRGDTFSATFTVLGFAERPVRRSGAVSGDVLCVTGVLGGPGAALAAWRHSGAPVPRALARFVHPEARLSEGQWLAANGARAMIDISDGLAADARHLAAASGLEAEIDAMRVPRFEGISAEDALASGEEYELLVALRETEVASIISGFTNRFSLGLTPIGHLTARPDAARSAKNSALRVELPGGHDHFSL